jgi:two-component system OmpR family sensor kinase
VANLASSTRSAAQATFSAYRRLPIRWRLAGGSALLTLVILCGFAVIVGVLTTGRIASDFDRQVAESADKLEREITLDQTRDGHWRVRGANLDDFAASQGAAIRVVLANGSPLTGSNRSPYLGRPLASSYDYDGWRVETRETNFPYVYAQYARRLSEVKATAARVRVFLGMGVLGGTLLALLAGVATARRAMSPIAELTEAARIIARTRDPSVRIPRSEADDEVAELARTLEGMLRELTLARVETEAMLERQREFAADASHELRTPLTSVLANLELLEEELSGEQRQLAASALRSSRRMRRLVADLLLLARADAGRTRPHEPVDLSEVLTDAVAELEPVAGDHEITVAAAPGAIVLGARDELHRLALNLLENALRHTDPETAVEAGVERENGHVVLYVEDDGPGIPPEAREKVFERFYRGAGDRSGSSGLGLSIVRAVADSHGGAVSLVEPLDGRGARFVVRMPAAEPGQPAAVAGRSLAMGAAAERGAA